MKTQSWFVMLVAVLLILGSCNTPVTQKAPSSQEPPVPPAITPTVKEEKAFILTDGINKWKITGVELTKNSVYMGQSQTAPDGSYFLIIHMDASLSDPLKVEFRSENIFVTDSQGNQYRFAAFQMRSDTKETDLFFEPVPEDQKEFTLHVLDWQAVHLGEVPIVSNPIPTEAQFATPQPSITPVAYNDYTVLEGDTWWSIAVKFGVAIDELLASNPEISSRPVPAGTVIKIPIH